MQFWVHLEDFIVRGLIPAKIGLPGISRALEDWRRQGITAQLYEVGDIVPVIGRPLPPIAILVPSEWPPQPEELRSIRDEIWKQVAAADRDEE